MFDQTGATSFSDTLNDHRNACTRLTTLAKDRVDKGLVNTTARASYGLINVKPKTMHEVAAESEAGYALVLFGFGVLQDDDVTWEPKLPAWKMKAILSMTMVSDFILLRLICRLHPAYRIRITNRVIGLNALNQCQTARPERNRRIFSTQC